jgi:hypothetical protein
LTLLDKKEGSHKTLSDFQKKLLVAADLMILEVALCHETQLADRALKRFLALVLYPDVFVDAENIG